MRLKNNITAWKWVSEMIEDLEISGSDYQHLASLSRTDSIHEAIDFIVEIASDMKVERIG